MIFVWKRFCVLINFVTLEGCSRYICCSCSQRAVSLEFPSRFLCRNALYSWTSFFRRTRGNYYTTKCAEKPPTFFFFFPSSFPSFFFKYIFQGTPKSIFSTIILWQYREFVHREFENLIVQRIFDFWQFNYYKKY